ncbi:hypothetical protein COO60DRAFT_272523 [Scenedesmus sp. NREL 46B-D3]|nr:hypothetical protein COO60DRAFT_272523 [Scenedesmus sp. NREL 46B-D3]
MSGREDVLNLGFLLVWSLLHVVSFGRSGMSSGAGNLRKCGLNWSRMRGVVRLDGPADVRGLINGSSSVVRGKGGRCAVEGEPLLACCCSICASLARIWRL